MVLKYSRQSLNNIDIKSVVNILKSDWLTSGPTINKFEQTLCKLVGAKYGVMVNSATSALHLACLALGLKKKNIFWTCSNSFVASANCGLYCGASVDFVDINPLTYNISITHLKEKLAYAKKKNKLPKIIIPIAFAGQSCEMKEIKKLSEKYNFKIIEDASHALGARYFGKAVGNCKYSDITIFSFHPVKIITTGEGGIATTNNLQLAQQMSALRNHGIFRNKIIGKKNINRPWMFYQRSLGFNYRISDIHAALGLSQLRRIKNFVKKRNKIAKIYNNELKNLPLKLPTIHKNNYSSFHLYVVQVKKNNAGITRDKLFKKLKKKGIMTNIHYIPIYKHPYFKRFKIDQSEFVENNKYFKNAISIPLYPSMEKKDIYKVVTTIKKIFKYKH